ncbi:camp-dependent protein kinase [Nesidiocoris tenuis]|uniref:Camp-dependent protein kinase n=1 Tax=Nesidiocoris tenuis TaxID=355587 RepID=A0ABN7AMG4_9HEMI|nr:camp-dependent protein kinase [Nesidiocoris tenuis]
MKASRSVSPPLSNGSNFSLEELREILAGSKGGATLDNSVWKKLLIDLTMNFLITNPKDLISFGLEYFEGLRTKKYSMANIETDSDSDEEQEPPGVDEMPQSWGEWGRKPQLLPKMSTVALPPPRVRRKSVYAEPSPSMDDDEWKPAVYPKTDDQRRTCRERMRDAMLFKELPSEDLGVLVDAMFYKEVEPNERIIAQGEDGDYFYVIDSGLYEAYYASSEGVRGIAKYNNHGTFGELALMYNVPRTCSIKSLTRGGLWALDRDTFKRVVVKSAMNKRTRYMNFLHKVPLLRTLNEYEMLNVADAIVTKEFAEGDYIITQGEEADGMYFVEEGRVDVKVKDNSGKEIELQELGVGDYLGELALLEKQPRAASATATSHVKAGFLSAEAFERLLGPCTDLMKGRFSDYKREMSTKMNPIAVLPTRKSWNSVVERHPIAYVGPKITEAKTLNT